MYRKTHRKLQRQPMYHYLMTVDSSAGTSLVLFGTKFDAESAFHAEWCFDGTVRLYQGNFGLVDCSQPMPYKQGHHVQMAQGYGRKTILGALEYDKDGEVSACLSHVQKNGLVVMVDLTDIAF